MVDQIVELFTPVPPGWVVDATVGGAGHAAALLARHEHLRVLGLDQDADALAAAAERLRPFGDRALLHRTRFDALDDIVQQLGTTPVSGVLFDLGVSSPQLDRAARGFSYRHDAPARHAHGPAPGPHGRRRRQRHRRAGAGRAAPRLRRRALRPPHRQGDRRRAARGHHRPSWPSWSATPSPRRPAAPAATPPSARSRRSASRSTPSSTCWRRPSTPASPPCSPAAAASCSSYHSGEDRIVKARLRHAATGGWTGPAHLPPPSRRAPDRPPPQGRAPGRPPDGRGARQPPRRERPPARRREARAARTDPQADRT